MKLRTKLIGAFGLLAVIMLAITVTGYWEADNLASALYEVGVVRLPSIQGLDQITSAMTALKGSEQTILVESVDDATIAEQLEAQRKAWLQADAGWNLYEPLPQSAEEAAEWKAFIPAWTAWKKDYEAVTTLAVEGHRQNDPSILARAREQSKTRTANLEQRAEALLAAITAINSDIATAAKKRSIESFHDVHRIQTIMIISSGIGIISAGFLGLFLGRIVTKPLEQMVHALGRIGRGDFSASVPVRSRDEIGQIAIATNAMVVALRATEGRLQDVSDNLPNGVVYQVVREPDATIRFPYISSGIERLMGVSAEAVLRDSSVFRELIVEEDLALLDSGMRTSQDDFSVLNVNIRMRRRDGAIRWMRETASPRWLPDGRILWGGILVDITELKQTEEALRASEERFSRAFNLSPVRMGIIRQKDAVILDLSARWLRDMGFAREEIVGHSLFTLKEWIGEEEHPKLRKVLADCKPVRNLEGVSYTKTGEGRHSVLSVEPIELSGETCMLWASNDITERKRSEQALQKSEALFRAMFENATVGVCLTSTDGRFLSVNRTFSDVLGYGKEELEQKYFDDITHYEDRQIGDAFLGEAGAAPAGSVHFEKRYLHKDGRVIWAYVSTALLESPTGDQYFITHVQDITERKKSENDLRNSEERFRQLVENIQEVFWIRDVAGDQLLYISPGYEKVWG
ncbi:MAG: PAS domain S-box protein, partial [Blastocatellia bacterium]